MLASGFKCGAPRQMCASRSSSLHQEVSLQELTMMLQSTGCLFPEVALFLDVRDLCRLGAAARDIIPEAWENEVWHVVANGACSGFRRAFRLLNLDKHTIINFMKHVVYTTPVFDNAGIVVDSKQVASTLVQFVRESTVPRPLSAFASKSFFTRFQFDEDILEDYMADPSEIPFSMPVVFELGGDQYLLELSLHGNGLKMSVHNYSKAALCKDNEADDEEDEEPVALSKPLRIQLCSISSPVVLRNEYVLSYADVDVPGYGTCDMPLSTDLTIKALADGFMCMVSVTEMTWDKLDELRLEDR